MDDRCWLAFYTSRRIKAVALFLTPVQKKAPERTPARATRVAHVAHHSCVRLHLRGIAENAKKEYNSLSQLVGDYQEHATVVNVGTSPKVGYRYDRLHRRVDFDRGKLTREDDLIDPLVRKAQWTLDATGNWSRFRRFDQSDSTDAALDQTRGRTTA